MTGLQAISVDKARQIATKKGLKPARVRGTEKVQFTKGRNANVEPSRGRSSNRSSRSGTSASTSLAAS